MNRLPSSLRVFTQALIDWWDGWLPLMLINLAAAVCVLLLVPGPPAILSLYVVANQLAHGRAVDLADFARGVRRYFFKSWLWILPNLIIAFLASVGLRFYGTLGSDLGAALQILVLVVVAFWVIVQFYALPYLIEQQEKRLLLAWRNALFTALASPLYTLAVALIAALIVAVSVLAVAPIFLGGAGLFALFGTRAVFNRLEVYKVRERDSQGQP